MRNGVVLTWRDRQDLHCLMGALLWRFTTSAHSLTEIEALGLLQHYGLPTPLVDFTGDLGHAFTFAAAELKTIGRICVLPLHSYEKTLAVANFGDHGWAERARRQFAFGVAMPDSADFKSSKVRSELGLKWFEFPIQPADYKFFRSKYSGLIRTLDDPSAGFCAMKSRNMWRRRVSFRRR
jgi:hypothetical protein